MRMFAAGLLILCAGVVIGWGLGFRAGRVRDSPLMVDPRAVPTRMADLVSRQLGLNKVQQERLHEIFESKRLEIDSVRSRILPEMDVILEDIRKQVEAVLDPAQAKAWNEKFHELRERWRPQSGK